MTALLLLAGCGEEGPAAPRPPVGIEEGNLAPTLEGRLPGGEAFSLAERRGAPVVLVFYRSGSCGLCRVRLERLARHLAEYRALGAEVFAVTLDPPGASAEIAAGAGLTVTTVGTDSAAFRRWGLLAEGEPAPRPGTFAADGDGVLLFGHVGRNAGDRADDAGVLAALGRRGDEP